MSVSESGLPERAVAPDAGRRRWLGAAVAGLAALAGGGLAWWRTQPQGSDEEAGTALAALWALQLARPDGSPLRVADFRGKPLVLNFWATWCPPCIEELPLLNRFYQDHSAKGWQVLGLAVDQPSSVVKFLAKMPLSFPVGMAGLEGTDLSKSLGNLSGGLPFSVVIGADGRVIQRKMGQIKATDLEQWSSLSG